MDSSVPDSNISVDGFKLYRRDGGNSRRGGSVLVYVPTSVRSFRRDDLERGGIEAIWLELRIDKTPILLCNIYRPPAADGSILDGLSDMLKLATNERKELMLIGDFNCNILSPNSYTDLLLSTTENYQLSQLLSEPTRITSKSQTLIDLCFVSSPQCFHSSGTFPLARNDHLMIYALRAGTNRNNNLNHTFRNVRSFKRCDMVKLQVDLHEAPWGVMDTFDSLDDKWDYW